MKDSLEALAPSIRLAFIYGPVAAGTETALSDVDLLVVGETGLSELSLPPRDAAGALGREVNPTVYSESEFSEKLRAKNRFLLALFDKPKLFVVGKEAELGRIAAAAAN